MGGSARDGLKRLYVVEFDSLSQHHLVALGRTTFGADATSSFVAMMRLADLLSETVVLTDNAIFDGIMFHRLGPRRMLQLVGRPVGASLAFPFEILGAVAGAARRRHRPQRGGSELTGGSR